MLYERHQLLPGFSVLEIALSAANLSRLAPAPCIQTVADRADERTLIAPNPSVDKMTRSPARGCDERHDGWKKRNVHAYLK